MKKTKFNYDKYRKSIHNKFNTSDETLNKIVKNGTGQKINNKTRIVKGESNEVYDAELANGSHCIIRISRLDKPFEKEKWALGKLKPLGIPVPEILFIEDIQAETETLSICIENKLPGETIDHIKNFDYPNSKEIFHEAGRILSVIHTVPANGFHRLDGEGKGEYQNFEEFSKREIGKLDSYLEIAKRRDLDTTLIYEVIDILKRDSHLLFDKQPYLNHGDFSPKHIMIAGGKITGIVDFGNMKGQLPLYDFVWWEFWRDKPEPLLWLKEGYGNKSIFDGNYPQKLSLLKLYLALNLYSWCDFIGQQDGFERATRSMKKEKEYLNSI